MPVYTYLCDNCGFRFDHKQRFNEKHLIRCPECNKNTLRRVYRPVGVVFKGSGFYVTDNRSSSSKRKPSSTDTKPNETDKESKSETKSESKSETNSNTKKKDTS
jgi:putative FmdB family regulatory protein